jgi:hypothetical protein
MSQSAGGTLDDALTEVLGRLRANSEGSVPRTGDAALRRAADRFVGRLADHLRFSEGTLFPALREVHPAAEAEIEGLEQDHGLFQSYARDLAVEIRDRRDEEAYGVAREFLALLFAHLERETAGVGRIERCLDTPNARQLAQLLLEGRLREMRRVPRELNPW